MVPLLKNTLSRASRNWSRILFQYAGSVCAGSGGAPAPRGVDCAADCAANGVASAVVIERRKLRRPVILPSRLQISTQDQHTYDSTHRQDAKAPRAQLEPAVPPRDRIPAFQPRDA